MILHFGIIDAIDILLVGAMLYYIYRLMKESGTLNIFIGVLTFIALWVVVTELFNMRLLGAILDKLISVGMLILVILFQDEIRRFLVGVGSHRNWQILYNYFRPKGKQQQEARPYIAPLVDACLSMARTKTGALIVIQREVSLTAYERTGETIDADVSTRLIENIFFKNSPLHDGAMILAHNRIVAAGCILPVSHSQEIPKALGLRHRSALGMSQESDAIAVIVSEETGNISVARSGKFYLHLTGERLEAILREEA